MVKLLVLGSLGTKPNKKMVETIQNGMWINPDERDKMADTLIGSFGQNLPQSLKKKDHQSI